MVLKYRGFNPVHDHGTIVHIHLNGEDRIVGESPTITQLLQELGFGTRRVAVEVNCEIVPRSEHGVHVLRAGDRVEIVRAVGGG